MQRQPQDIETIIASFENYALGDIRHNKSKPIAAFILAICFIDQLASFRYTLKRNSKERPEDFINDYMPDYGSLRLYNYVRNCLVHNYSSQGKFDIDNIGNEDVPYTKKGNIIYINTNVFIDHLENAFEKVVKDFRRIGSEAYNNARQRSIEHPVLISA